METGDRPVSTESLAFTTRAERVEEGSDKEASVTRVAEVLEVGVERLAGIGSVRVGR